MTGHGSAGDRRVALLDRYVARREAGAADIDAVVTATMDGTITGWSPGAEQLYGFSADESVGKNLESLAPPGQGEAYRDRLDRLRRGDSLRSMVTLRRKKTGAFVEVLLNATPIYAATGVVTAFVETAAIYVPDQIADAEFRLAIDAAPNCIAIVDRAGCIVLVNAELERRFHYTKDELIGRPIEALMPQRHAERHRTLRAAFMDGVTMREMGVGRELWALRKDGTEFPVEVGLAPARSRGSRLVIAVIIDVTDRKMAEAALAAQTEELRRSNEDLEQFAYVASHDLQEPLRMVASYTQLLAERYRGKLDERADRYIDYAVDGARRMQGLVRDLLTYSRVGRGERSLYPVDSGVVVNRVLKTLDRAIDESGTQVEVGKLPIVSADETSLEQVFQNLIVNAIKFRSQRPPAIQIMAERKQDDYVFSVADNGIGIETSGYDRIFQMFQRLHERDKYEGSGIGLAIAKKIVERLGGRIWVTSELGNGSKFFFSVPITRGRAG